MGHMTYRQTYNRILKGKRLSYMQYAISHVQAIYNSDYKSQGL